MQDVIKVEIDTQTGKPTPKGNMNLMLAIAECIFECIDQESKPPKEQDHAIIQNNIELSMEWFN